jgi:3-hydroxyacyl-[acyl-carrier-protein] dehydratase
MNVSRMREASDLTAALATLPHRPPFRMVDRLVSAAPGEARAERRVTANDPLVGDGLLPCLVLEGLAQTAALIAGAEVGRHDGYLVAMRNVAVEGQARVGDTVALFARRTATLGGLHRVEAEASVEGRVILRGELTFAIQAP